MVGISEGVAQIIEYDLELPLRVGLVIYHEVLRGLGVPLSLDFNQVFFPILGSNEGLYGDRHFLRVFTKGFLSEARGTCLLER